MVIVPRVLSGLAPAEFIWLVTTAPGSLLPHWRGGGQGHAVRLLRFGRGHRAAGAHRPRLPPVPLPRLREAVQRTQRRPTEPGAAPGLAGASFNRDDARRLRSRALRASAGSRYGPGPARARRRPQAH